MSLKLLFEYSIKAIPLVYSMQKDSRIKDLLKIPREENVHAVIAVGHPAVTYQRLTGRKKAVSRFIEP